MVTLDFAGEQFACRECGFVLGLLFDNGDTTEVKVYMADGVGITIYNGVFQCPTCLTERVFRSVASRGCFGGGLPPVSP